MSMLTRDGLELSIATQRARAKFGELDVTVSIPGFIDLCELAIKGITRPEEVSPWQPIATAPKYRNIILTDGKVVGEGGWMTDVEQGADYEGQAGMAGWWCIAHMPDGKPTHWMPLPVAASTRNTLT